MADRALETRVYPPYLPEDRRALAAFLAGHGLALEQDVDYSVAALEAGRMVGTGSLSGRTLKCLAVDETHRGSGLASLLVSRLEAAATARGSTPVFVFTRPANASIFQDLGYRRIAEVPETALLLERGDGIRRWTDHLRGLARPGAPIAALVMNCNPITLGHLHLIRTACAESAWVFLFVVAEDASVFPSAVRLHLVREATAALPNLTVVSGSDYLVSRASFPSYFLKNAAEEATEIHARLDARVFLDHVVPALGIQRRYVGEEPYCPVTRIYNQVLKEELRDIDVREIPRLAKDGRAISASEVRRLLREGDREAVSEWVPPATMAFLRSEEAGPILARIRAGNERH